MSELEKPVQGTGIDPFSPENAPRVSLIVLMRIYDALMALLQVQDEAAHDALDKIHESGEIAWSLPWLDLSRRAVETEEPKQYVPATVTLDPDAPENKDLPDKS